MFTVEQKGSNRLDIAFSGKVDSEAMQAALDDLIHRSQGIENGKMLFRVGNFNMPTLGAIGVELSRLPKIFRLIGTFDKATVIANQSWIRRGSKIKGALIPGLQIKAFESGQEDEAEAWLAE